MTGDPRTEAVVQRILSAPPHVVYDEWLDPEALAEWMCPRPARPTRIELDPRVGGGLRLDIDDEGTPMIVTGHYLILERPHRISFTWTCSTWSIPSVDSVVTVTLQPEDGAKTLMTIRHALLPHDVVENHERGWSLIARQLDQKLSPL
jgi:uncharacterized protein YndB with AHSA1/START domain